MPARGVPAGSARRVPAALLARAREVLAGRLDPVVARDAASVVLLRDGAGGLETWLLRRSPGLVFAPGMHAFPGGGVDATDDDAPPRVGPDPEAWAPLLGCADGVRARALVAAGARELFEETGVLLAVPSPVPPGDRPVPPGAVQPAAVPGEDARCELEAGRLSLAALLARHRLALDLDLVAPWAHWVTPAHEPRRYDTRFLVAALPGGQQPRLAGGEADAAGWVRPADALDRHARGALPMLPPTSAVLRDLAAHDRVADVLAAAAGRPVRRVQPRLVADGDDVLLLVEEGPVATW